MNKQYCGKNIDPFGYVKCGQEIKENSIPQGIYFQCAECKKKGAKK